MTTSNSVENKITHFTDDHASMHLGNVDAFTG